MLYSSYVFQNIINNCADTESYLHFSLTFLLCDLQIQLSELERKLIDESEKHKKTQKELLDLHVGKHKKIAQKKEGK